MPTQSPAAAPEPTLAEDPSASVRSAHVEVAQPDILMALTGPGAERLAILERACQVTVGLRGDTIHLQGTQSGVDLAERVLLELLDVLDGGSTIKDEEIGSAVRLVRDHPDVKLLDLFRDVVVTGGSGKPITPRGMAQKLYVQAIRDHDVVFGVGPAGTGKTYLAMAMAVSALQQRLVRRIVLTRPAVEAGEKLGFLPGDLADKVDPYLRPLYDALYDMMPNDKANALIQRGTIEVAPLAFMRGRTLNDSFVILDEAQNTTVAQMKMFLTRVGQRSKAVITGDVTQVDLPGGTISGLRDAIGLLEHVEGLRSCYFGSEDVVRHHLVQRIVEAYAERDEQGLPHGRQSSMERSDG